MYSHANDASNYFRIHINQGSLGLPSYLNINDNW